MIIDTVQGLFTLSENADANKTFTLFLILFCPFLVVSPIVLFQFDLFTPQTYFLAVFIWFLITSELCAPPDRSMTWWSNLKWFRIIGWLVTALIVSQRVIAVVQ